MSEDIIGGGMTSAEVEAWKLQNPTAETISNAEEAEKKALLPIAKLDTMPGNALLALIGAKTLYTGATTTNVQPGQFAWLTTTTKANEQGDSKTVQVPVIIDSVGKPAPRKDMTDDQLKAAGYRDEIGFKFRLGTAQNYLGRAGLASGDLTDPVNATHFENSPSSRIGFHLATPAELKDLAAAGNVEVPSVKDVQRAVKDAVNDLRTNAALKRDNVTDAIGFATEQGIDVTRAKQNVLDTYNRELGTGRQVA